MKESAILSNISAKLGIESLNAMQQQMAANFNFPNIILLSPTGSGKTLAFTLPLIKNLKEPSQKIQAVVIAPSRELAVQIGRIIQAVASDFKTTCCYGGHSFEDEEKSLSVVPDIVIGTPGRLLDHVNRGNINLRSVRILVLDEFDKSLELGFTEEMRKILRHMPNVSRRILTSATAIDAFPEFLDMSSVVTYNFLNTGNPRQRMQIYKVDSPEKDKLPITATLLDNIEDARTIIFSNYRESSERIFDYLLGKGYPVGIYHGGMDQIEREKAIAMFNNGTFKILVTTDLGSRGLDIPNVENIIHYHIPVSEEVFTHRNGRSARVDASGKIYVILGPTEHAPAYIEFDGTLVPDNKKQREMAGDTATLFFSAGKKEKISRGDIVGFLTAKGQMDAKKIGRIDLADHYALVAVPASDIDLTLHLVQREKIKGKRVRISIARQ